MTGQLTLLCEFKDAKQQNRFVRRNTFVTTTKFVVYCGMQGSEFPKPICW